MARVHHLNCGTFCPRGKRLMTGGGGLLEEGRAVCHCLLIETGRGLVLVDTGFGTGDVTDPGRLGRPFRALLRPRLAEEETALRQVQGLGFSPADVTDIVVTHLDLDHAGGLGDFPRAQVHAFAPELRAALHPGLRERARYVPAQWEHGPQWREHEVAGDSWFGFENVRLLPDLDTEVVLVPLPGHTRGHSGVAVERDGRWLLHCGDAFFHHGEVRDPPDCPPGWKLFQEVSVHDRTARDANKQRLRELARAHGDEVALICSHDPELLDASS